MIKRVIVIILALGLVSWGVVSCITSGNANNGQISPYDADNTAVAATTNAEVNAEIATANADNTDIAATANANPEAATATANAEAATANAEATQIALTPIPSTVTVDLPTAVNQQLVTVSFTSTGGASGNVINITLNRFKSQNTDIHVTLPPGLLLTNSDPSEQNMILEGSIEMELSLQDITTSLDNVLAYCVQLHSGNPTNGTSLTLSGQASPDLVSLMKAAAARNDSILVIQAAVWAITDNPTRDDLNQVGYQLSDQDLQSVRDLLRAAGLNPANYQLTA